MQELPDWLSAYIREMCIFLSLDEWNITVTLADEIGNAGPGQQVSAEAQVHMRYRHASILLRRSLLSEPREKVEHIMLHELLHVVLGPVAQAVDRIIELLPQRMHDHAVELWYDGSEHAIEGLTRALRAARHTEPHEAL